MLERDFQRKRVYEFEDFYTSDNSYTKIFVLSKNRCYEMIQQIISDYGYNSKIAHITFYRDNAAQCWMLGDSNGIHINLPKFARNAVHIAHEVAHGLVGLKYGWEYEAPHGPVFLATDIDLLEHYCGYDGSALREAAISWGLKIASKRSIPKRKNSLPHQFCFKQAA